MKDIPLFKKDLSIISAVNSASQENRDAEYPIMSISKSFCGALSALMAVDGKFGINNINATLLEALETAKRAHPARIAAIEKYEALILKKNFGGIKISELLSHRAGVSEKMDNWYQNIDEQKYLNKPLEFFDAELSLKSKAYKYSNSSYHMMEELISLCADSGSYYAELKNRILDPLELSHTKLIVESAEAQARTSDMKFIEGVMSDDGVATQTKKYKTIGQYPQQCTIPIAAGGLCSSVNDLEKYSAELAKMICGLPNGICADAEKNAALYSYYCQARALGNQVQMADASTSAEMRYAATNYSLGVMLGENANGHLSVKHNGGYTANYSGMEVEMPFSLDDFLAGRVSLPEGQAPKINIEMQQMDTVARHSLLTLVDYAYLKLMASHFISKSSEEEKRKFAPDGIGMQHFVLLHGEPVYSEWQKHLIDQGKLPKDFAKYHEEIRAAFAPAQEELRRHVVENYFGENGFIDSASIEKNFQTAADFIKVAEVINSGLQAAENQAKAIFTKSESWEAKILAERSDASAGGHHH